MESTSSKIVFIALLSVATLVLFGLLDRYNVRGPELLVNPAGQHGFGGWVATPGTGSVETDGEVVRLANPDPDGSVALSQLIPAIRAPSYVRVALEYRLRDVSTGLAPWERLRVIMVQRNAEGVPRWELPHTVVLDRGDAEWQQAERIFWISRRTHGMEFRIQLNKASGLVEVRDLTVRTMQEKDGFGTLRYILFMSWLVAWVWVVVPILSQRRYKWRAVLAMLVGLGILGGSLTPHTARQILREKIGFDSGWVESRQAHKEQQQQAQEEVKPQPPPPPAAAVVSAGNPSLIWYAVQKSGHFTLFVLLSVAVFWARPRTPVLPIVACLLSYAMIAELLQLFAEERTPQVSDAGLNVAGVLLGVLVVLAWRALRRRVGGSRDDGFAEAEAT